MWLATDCIEAVDVWAANLVPQITGTFDSAGLLEDNPRLKLIIARMYGGDSGPDRAYPHIFATASAGLRVEPYLVVSPGKKMTTMFDGWQVQLGTTKPKAIWADCERKDGKSVDFCTGYIQDVVAEAKRRWTWAKIGIYCVTTDTPILTQDLRWVSAGDLKPGDPIVGFEENNPGNGKRHGRSFHPAHVTVAETARAACLRIILSTGESIRCTPAHKWLCRIHSGLPMEWRTTAQLRELVDHPRPYRKHSLALPRFFPIGEARDDYAAGFLSAAFDSEGCLAIDKHGCLRLDFVQKPNALLDQVEVMLKELAFSYSIVGRTTDDIRQLRLTGGRREVLRFLAEMRPPRLLDVWRKKNRPFEMLAEEWIGIEAIEDAGVQEIAVLSSSSGTYVAQGFGSHNTGAWIWDTLVRHGWEGDIPLWVAHYIWEKMTAAGKGEQYHNFDPLILRLPIGNTFTPHIPLGWKGDATPVIWQFSDTGSLSPLTRGIDLNLVSRGWYDALYGSGPVVPPVEPLTVEVRYPAGVQVVATEI